MRSSKSRSRNKNRNNRPSGGNIINRVFDSSGPEGKVRGTPQQIIDKYNQLARDAQLSGDRVAVENFQQHAEHYTRMLATAQKEMEARQQQHNQNQQNNQRSDNNRQDQGGQQDGRSGGDNNNQQQGSNQQQGGGNRRRDRGDDRNGDQQQQPTAAAPADVIDTGDADSGLVETPEAKVAAPAPDGGEQPKADKPKRTRTRKKATPKVDDAPAEAADPAPAADASEPTETATSA